MKFYPRHIVNLRLGVFKILVAKISGGYSLEGPDISKFENEFAKYIGTKFAIGVSQARLGLIISLKSLGLNKGDEVILSSFNFHIIPECIRKLGLVPVFVDIRNRTYNIDPDLIKDKINKKTKAIIITHMFGQPVSMDSILEIAKEHKIKVIEDCAHALGAEYNGKKVGSIADIGIFSFGIGKNMPCFGGGMITTNDVHLFGTFRQYINHGKFPPRKEIAMSIIKHLFIFLATTSPMFTLFTFPIIRVLDIFGVDIREFEKKDSLSDIPMNNFDNLPLKLTNMQAAVGLKQIEKVEYFNNKRIQNSILLNKNLGSFNSIGLPEITPNSKPIYLYYKIMIKNKDSFRKRLFTRGIDTSKKCEMSNCSAECPIAASLTEHVLEVPNNHFLSTGDINGISESIKEILFS